MESKKEKFDESLAQQIVNPAAVLEWLEEQAKESVRGRIHDKPRWAE